MIIERVELKGEMPKPLKKQKCRVIENPAFMRITGLEPARRGHQNLNLARLPIPPYPLRSERAVARLSTIEH